MTCRPWGRCRPITSLQRLDRWGCCANTSLESCLPRTSTSLDLCLDSSLFVHGGIWIPIHVRFRTPCRCAGNQSLAGLSMMEAGEVRYLVCEMARSPMPRSTVAPLSVLAFCPETPRASTRVARLDMEPSCGRLSVWALYLSSPGLRSAPYRPPSRLSLPPLPPLPRGDRLRVRGRLSG